MQRLLMFGSCSQTRQKWLSKWHFNRMDDICVIDWKWKTKVYDPNNSKRSLLKRHRVSSRCCIKSHDRVAIKLIDFCFNSILWTYSIFSLFLVFLDELKKRLKTNRQNMTKISTNNKSASIVVSSCWCDFQYKPLDGKALSSQLKILERINLIFVVVVVIVVQQRQ